MLSDGPIVLHEDEHCLAVSKPAGQFTQGSWVPPGEQTLEQAVRDHLNPADPASVYLGIVHRLDRPVSGILLWAKNPRAARRLAGQFEKRRVEKEYWAVVEDRRPQPDEASDRDVAPAHEPEGEWTDYLTRPGVSGVAQVVAADHPGARMAVTRYRLEPAKDLPAGTAWLRLWPQTGRTHQLRVQTAARGWPILGDTTYGATHSFLRGIALHARRLRVQHPALHTSLELTAPLPQAWGDEGIILPTESGG